MSETSHHHHIEDKSLASYIIGFVLSLIFTLIPYELVANHHLNGSTLLATILGFALMQLIVQITFFLHLGRGPKPKWNLFFFGATVGIILVVVGGSIIIINNLHSNMSPIDQTMNLVNSEGISQVGGKQTGACPTTNTNHVIAIKNDQAKPVLTTAKECDTLTFTDKDTANLDIVFESTGQSKTYAGQSLLEVQKGQSQTITLSELGTFKFKDSLNPLVTGSFTVAK